MLGYITIEKSELKVREYNVYQGYYCGICKSIGRRWGQIPRFALSFDIVFLAILLSGIKDEKDSFSKEHCVIHPFMKRFVKDASDEVDYAADMMIILAYHKSLDDLKDEKKLKAFISKSILRRAYKKLLISYPEICGKIEKDLSEISRLENENSENLDLLNDYFADIMGTLFTGFSTDVIQRRILSQAGRNLGKWIYTIDAVDDLKEDVKNGSYNPLKCRINDLEGIEDLLYNYMAEAVKAFDLIDIKKNKGIIDNIIFLGLRRRTDEVLGKGKDKNEKSI